MALSSSDLPTLAAWDAIETCARIRRKDVSAQEVVEAAIARAEEARHLGAVFENTFERARAGVANLNSGAPLFGVPTFIKDMTQIQGVPMTWGTRAAGRYLSRRNDPIVTSIEETGVVVLGKSACSELALIPTTEPLGWPLCRNPWDPSRSSGGSSGGAATVVAAGVVPMAHAVDGGGSIRIPAACCGLVGLKPSRFRLDMKGSNLLAVNVVCDGVVTRTVRDTVAFFAAIESRHAPRRVAPIGQVADRPARPLRMGVFVGAPTGTPVNAEVQEAALAAARLCQTLGHGVEEILMSVRGRALRRLSAVLVASRLAAGMDWAVGNALGLRAIESRAVDQGTHALLLAREARRTCGHSPSASLPVDVRPVNGEIRRTHLADGRGACPESRILGAGPAVWHCVRAGPRVRSVHAHLQRVGCAGDHATPWSEQRRLAHRRAVRCGSWE